MVGRDDTTNSLYEAQIFETVLGNLDRINYINGKHLTIKREQSLLF